MPETKILTPEEIIEAGIELSKEDGCYIYFLIKDREIVYVGQTIGEPVSRASKHRADGKDFNSYYFVQVKRAALDIMESIYINLFNPKLNKQFPNGRPRANIKLEKIADLAIKALEDSEKENGK